MPSGEIANLETALRLTFLRPEALDRAQSLTEQELGQFLPWDLDPVLWDRAITVYLESRSFVAANRRVEILNAGTDEFSKEQIERLIRGAANNVNVKQSFGFAGLISGVRSSSKAISNDELNELLGDFGLLKYLVDDVDED